MTDIERPYYQNSLGTSYKDYIIAILLKIFFLKNRLYLFRTVLGSQTN